LAVRPVLNSWYQNIISLASFPSVFIIGFAVAVLLIVFNFDLLLQLYFIYFNLVLVSSYQNKSLKSRLSVIAVWKQFYGYGIGFMESFLKVIILKQKPQILFLNIFIFDIKNYWFNWRDGSGKTQLLIILAPWVSLFICR
jgi:hypothetical protein